jgi:hypothetical protein
MSKVIELLPSMLARGTATGAELSNELKISQPTLSRAIAQLGTRVIRIKGGRSSRYGLRYELPQIGSSWPVFLIDENGQPTLHGHLNALARNQYWFAAMNDQFSVVSDGLPLFIQDLWPQGFIGRTVPKRYPELGLPERITDWNDGHVLNYLTQRGDDSIGNLLIGDESLQRYLRQLQEEQTFVELMDRLNQYPKLANTSIAGTPPGSSAWGEHPKFATVVRTASGVRQVLVKFSPAGSDRASQRWSDLLVCEHLASRALSAVGVSSAATELIAAGDRMFLESERFDRNGAHGRRGIVSLAAVADLFIGRRDNWISASDDLRVTGKVTTQDAEAMVRLATFGQLIGNTDMHFGNLSFYFRFGHQLSLAPVYDMLPMIYAPVAGDELPDREFEVPLPGGKNLSVWRPIADVAEIFWRDVAQHSLITPEFSARALRNAALIARAKLAVPQRPAPWLSS